MGCDAAGKAPQIRTMQDRDLDAVERNERRSYQFPWSRGNFADCLQAGHVALVLEAHNEVIGHGVASIGAGESHLLNLCVVRDQQGKGLGRELLRHTLAAIQERGASVVFLEVRPTNWAANALYESMGFREIGRRKDYYPAALGHEDARVLALDLDQHPLREPL